MLGACLRRAPDSRLPRILGRASGRLRPRVSIGTAMHGSAARWAVSARRTPLFASPLTLRELTDAEDARAPGSDATADTAARPSLAVRS
jgi:hypothetical protein